MKTRLIILALACLALSGCSYRCYEEGGAKYTSWSFGTTQQVAPFTMEAGKKDDPSYRKLSSKGLSNDPAVEIVEAAVSAAVSAAK